jgi:hypothetical protein
MNCLQKKKSLHRRDNSIHTGKSSENFLRDHGVMDHFLERRRAEPGDWLIR